MSNEIDEVLNSALLGKRLGNSDLGHLGNKVGVSRYVRMANKIATILPEGRILDWGCGYGQMTYLLRNRGLAVVAYEVAKRPNIDKLPLFSNLDIVYSQEKSLLPFDDECFDAVLSSGTLEHVLNMGASLGEIRRVLKSTGIFFIYGLPNRHSYVEWLNDRLGISHPLRFSLAEIRSLLHEHGFSMARVSHAKMIPSNLVGFLSPLNRIYDSLYRVLLAVDGSLAKVPMLNRFSTQLEVVALKEETSCHASE